MKDHPMSQGLLRTQEIMTKADGRQKPMTGIRFYIPEATAATPVDGECIVNHWWTVHPERGVAFYASRKRPYGMEPGERDAPSPQCNFVQFTAEYIQRKFYPDCVTKQIPVVFLGHAVKEMHVQRRALAEHKTALELGPSASPLLGPLPSGESDPAVTQDHGGAETLPLGAPADKVQP